MSTGAGSKLLRIGIPMLGSAQWPGGLYYVQNLIACLKYLPAEERPQVVLFVSKGRPQEHYKGLLDEYTTVYLTNNYHWRNLLQRVISKIFVGRAASAALGRAVLDNPVDVVFPMLGAPARPLPVAWAGWIPDFQHIHLPEMFSAREQAARDSTFRRLGAQAPLMVFSSRDAEKDFMRFSENKGACTRVLSFSAVLASDVFETDAESIRRMYNLPPKFLLITNQFWKHKDHLTAFKALKLLKDGGLDVQMYCCGSLQDYRNPEYIKTLGRYITDHELGANIRILGLVPRDHQIQIMRLATALVQPTLFEGWSTVIEEGKSLGKVMYVSDLPVNIEQQAERAIYFARGSATDLADKIKATWEGLNACPDLEVEAEVRTGNEQRYADFARTFVKIMREVLHQAAFIEETIKK